ncbi:hypothetical protein SASPL_127574 [Salvia splendens]|uniref:Uncharacterized protein n=1 Tax=Salvia splendens TaxID=180675 RepID=A0A8X8XB48_SALSN|nr:hypothetical protein SASPL_127574 [Salvia splendens]
MVDQISSVPHNHQLFPTAEQLQFLDEINDDGIGGNNPSLDDLIHGMLQELTGGNITAANLSTDSPQFHSANENSRFYLKFDRVFKLGIHGRLGIISHAVLERYDNNQTSQNHDYYMFDFCSGSMDNVKQFLIQYCNERALEGCAMLQDPLSTFYDALLTGFPHQQTSSLGNNHAGQEIPEDEEEDANGLNPPKSYVASQRERAGKMKLKDLGKYFHLPLNEAAKEMKLCASAMQKGRLGKIKSLQNEIAKVSKSISSAGGAERSRLVLEKQQRLEGELAAFYQDK